MESNLRCGIINVVDNSRSLSAKCLNEYMKKRIAKTYGLRIRRNLYCLVKNIFTINNVLQAKSIEKQC